MVVIVVKVVVVQCFVVDQIHVLGFVIVGRFGRTVVQVQVLLLDGRWWRDGRRRVAVAHDYCG